MSGQTTATSEGIVGDSTGAVAGGTLAFQPTVAGPARQYQFDVFVRF